MQQNVIGCNECNECNEMRKLGGSNGNNYPRYISSAIRFHFTFLSTIYEKTRTGI